MWLRKNPAQHFTTPPEVIRGLLQWDYSDATITPRTPAYNPPSVAAAHRTPQDGRPSGAVGLASVFVPLTAILQGSVLKKRTILGGRFCGVKNASERRTFCCAVHQKRDFKAHPTASTALLVGSFQLAADSRLSTFDSQLFHSRPRLALGSRNSRSGCRLCGQRGLEFDYGLRKGLFDGRNHTTTRFIVCDPPASSFMVLRSGTRDPNQSPSSTRAPSPGHTPRSCQPPSPTD